MAWTFHWLRSWDAIWEPGHLARWRAAAERDDAHATPFTHPGVVRAWLESTGGEAAYAPFFLHARHAGGQEVLWLLVRPRAEWHTGFLRRLIPAGNAGRGGPHFAYNDPLAVPAADPGAVLAPGFWPAFEAELRRHEGIWFDSCVLHRIRAECLGEAAADPVRQTAPYLRLDAYADFPAYLAARRPSLAREIRRKARRLDAAGRVAFHVHGPGEADAVLAWLPDLEAARAARYPSSALPPGYLRRLVTGGLDAGVTHASVLRLDGRAIGWRLGLRQAGTLYGVVRGFAPEFERLSPGLLHYCRDIEWLFARGGRVYDFLIGQQAYKYDWTDGGEHVLHRIGIESRAPATARRRTAGRGLGQLDRLRRRAVAAALPSRGPRRDTQP